MAELAGIGKSVPAMRSSSLPSISPPFSCVRSTPLFLLAAFVASAQPLFGPVLPTISPDTYLSHYVDIGGRLLLEAQSRAHPLSYTGIWTDSGDAVITDGDTKGAVSWNASVNVGIGSTSMSYSFAYELELQNLGNGEAILVIKWTKSVSNGSSTGGVVSVHRIKRSSPNEVFPVSAGTGGRQGMSGSLPSARRGSIGGIGSSSGGFRALSFDYTYGYMGSNGVYNVVGGTLSGLLWQPGGIVALDRIAW